MQSIIQRIGQRPPMQFTPVPQMQTPGPEAFILPQNKPGGVPLGDGQHAAAGGVPGQGGGAPAQAGGVDPLAPLPDGGAAPQGKGGIMDMIMKLFMSGGIPV